MLTHHWQRYREMTTGIRADNKCKPVYSERQDGRTGGEIRSPGTFLAVIFTKEKDLGSIGV